MTLSVWQRTIVNTNGDVIGSASVEVRRESDDVLITLFSTPSVSGPTLSNPISADSAGFVRFYAAQGAYRITATSGAFSAVWRDVQLGTAQRFNADQNLTTADNVEFAGLNVDNVFIDGNGIGTATGEDLLITPQGNLIINADIDATGTLDVIGRINVDNLRLDGSTLSSTNPDNIVIAPQSLTAQVTGSLVPTTDDAYDLGSGSLAWRNLNVAGAAFLPDIFTDSVTIGNVEIVNDNGRIEIDGGLRVDTVADIGTPGTESAGVNIAGTDYTYSLRINDVAGTGSQTMAVLHKHSTTDSAIMAGVRSNSDTPSHANVTQNMPLFDLIGGGWATGAYRISSKIALGTGTGTISTTSMPGKIEFSTAKNGEVVLTTALTIDEAQNVTAVNTITAADATEDNHLLNRRAADARYALRNYDLFDLPGNVDTTLFPSESYEITSVLCVADASGSLNGKYFRLYGPGGTPPAIDVTAAEQIIDVWLNVAASGSQPASGAGRYIEVAINTNDTAATIADAIATALNSDVAFSAGVDGDSVIVASKLPNNFTDSTAENSGFTVVKLADGSGDRVGTFKFLGAILAPNGKIYCAPDNSTEILVIDPVTNITFTFGNFSGGGKWAGGVLAPNGKIYCAPNNATSVLVIDPATDTASTFGDFSAFGVNKWRGAVLAPNGKIYCIPGTATSILVIDPATDTASTFGSLATQTIKWYGGVLAPNGKIYCAPHNSTSILVIDPATDTASTFGNISGTSKYFSAVLAPNGKIYCLPATATSVLVIDPATNTTSTFGSLAGTLKWLGGVLAPNAKIYGIPRNSTSILVIDPATDTASTFGDFSASNKYFGGVLAPNGKIYCIPGTARSVLSIGAGNSDFPRWYLSAYFNKF